MIMTSRPQNGRLNVLELLANVNANLDTPRTNGTTRMMAASYKGYEAVVRFLLKRGANVKSRSLAGTTALDFATDPNIQSILADKLHL